MGLIYTPTMIAAAGTRHPAMEHAEFRVRAQAVSPAVIVTPIQAHLFIEPNREGTKNYAFHGKS